MGESRNSNGNHVAYYDNQESAHDWEAEKRKRKDFYDDGTMTFFWRTHTIITLIVFSLCLGYVAFYENISSNPDFNTKRGVAAVIIAFVLFGVTHVPDGPFTRPHPALWRFMLCLSIVYELFLVFILFQTPSDARKLLKHIDDDLGKPLPEKSYGGNCLIYDRNNTEDPWHNVWDKMDGFVVIHFVGWWLKTLILRDYWLCMVISIMFEVLEYTFEHQLPNFSECWWDHWIMDALVCNGLGIYLGMKTLNYLSMKRYHWRGMWNIPTYRGKITRVLKQFTPYFWTDFQWKPTSSFKRWIATLGIIGMVLLAEMNTFYLKFVLWVPPPHFLCLGRLALLLFWGAAAMRETFQYLDDRGCKKFGTQSWLIAAIIITELLITIKFDSETITKPLPSHIIYVWTIGFFLIVLWTIWHFYLQAIKMMQYREPSMYGGRNSQKSHEEELTPRKNAFYDPGDPDEVDTGMRNIVYENDRVRNDLLDEICKDIGIKDSMDLDFLDISHNTKTTSTANPHINKGNNTGSKEDDLDEIIPFGVNDCGEEPPRAPIKNKILHKPNHEYSPYARTTPNTTSYQNYSSAMPPPTTVQQQFMQKLICDDSPAFRSHPLFPLLRDLVLADMNFSLPSFPRQLIANLPGDFERLLRNFVMRNRTSESSGNASIDKVLTDALRYAHHSLISKIRSRGQQPMQLPLPQPSMPTPQRPPNPNPVQPPTHCQMAAPSPCQGGVPSTNPYAETNYPLPQPPQMPQMPQIPANPGSPSMHSMPGSPLTLPASPLPPSHRPRYNDPYVSYDMYGNVDYGMNSDMPPKQPGKKAVLPKESVAFMLNWLREHQDNPYPNDDEKEMLIQKTKLTINQINYWFTNARRRILPKWNSQKKEQELMKDEKKANSAIPGQRSDLIKSEVETN
ncbi:DgyrCDS13607 [Dimorphilus gyrociliatus]|uniref:Phosphatidylserine synthase n=1 Tax=Dimorphilus gyrociliatus TaxID=2664684 RepID=A0A7I8WB72_9ANNE|nr:DgyrCDS13607 [Dimorphilus gyrociliatus]